MRILHIMNYYQENMGYQENWLPYFQRKLGHEVEILTSDKYFPFPNYDTSMKPLLGDRYKGTGTFVDKGIKITRMKSLFEVSSKSIIVFNTLDNINEFNPDIIHLHGSTNLNLLQIIWFLNSKNIKLFIDSHSDYQVSNYKSFANKLYYRFWSLLYKTLDSKINLFLPTTKEGEIFLKNEFNISSKRCQINYLGVNTDSFYYDEKEKYILQNKYNIKNKLVIINAGKQYESKKIEFIIQILKKLIISHNRNDIVLILIGNATEEYDKIIQHESIGYKDSIIRIPFVKNEELKKYYSLADIGIWPGIPSNTIQEAMACETAMILPENGTTSHLIDGNGFIFSGFNPTSVAKKIDTLIQNNNLDLYKKSSRKIVKRYSWKQIAKESLDIYKLK